MEGEKHSGQRAADLTLQPKQIEQTIERLARRIQDRFPGSGLGRVCQQLLQIARRAESVSEWLGRPLLWVRMVAAALIGLLLIAAGGQLYFLDWPNKGLVWTDFFQGMEAVANEAILVGAAIFFLVTMEKRIKRRQGLKSLHSLRSIAHIIDMHQLVKDPERVQADVFPATQSSPTVKLSPFQLRRYLDYCSEMLSLTGKIAAEHVNQFDDALLVTAVNEIETLTSDLTRKIWQKIMILHSFDAESRK